MNDQGERCSSATDTEYGKRLRYCVTLMKRAQNDTERITCLFMVEILFCQRRGTYVTSEKQFLDSKNY